MTEGTGSVPGGPDRTDLLTFGEALASFRSSGALHTSSLLSVTPVGAELNVAIGLARLGHRSQWVGRVGDDPLGRLAAIALRGEGVDTTAIVDTAAATAVMVVLDRRPLPPQVIYHRAGSAGSRLAPADVLPALDRRPRLMHITGITPALSGTASATVEVALEHAETLGVEVSIDVNYRAKLWGPGQARDALTAVVRRATVVIGSADEIALVARGSDEREQVVDLLRHGVRTVVVKRGRRGATSYDGDGEHHQDAFAVTEVDSIGAGDAFSAGYLSGLLDGLDERSRLDRACRAGAFAVSASGDWDRSPTKRELSLLDAVEAEAAR